MLASLAGVGLIGMLLLSPALLPAFKASGTIMPPLAFDAANPRDLRTIHSADLVDFWLPSELHPLWGAAVMRITTQIHPIISARNVALGYVALALALAAALLACRQAWRWWVLLLAALLMSLGPVLSIGGARTGILLPYTMLLNIPEVGRANRPSHFVVIATLMLVPLVAIGVSQFVTRIAQVRRQRMLITVLVVLIDAELWPPIFPLLTTSAHPYYATLAAESGPLMILPPQIEVSDPLQAQMLHGRPIMGGFVSRTPPYAFASQVNGIRQLWTMQPDTEAGFGQPPGGALAGLNAYKIQRLVIEWDRLDAEQRPQLEAALAQALPGVSPDYSDGRLSSYRIPEAPTGPLIYVDSGWYPEEHNETERWRWMAEQGDIKIFNPFDHPTAVRLRLTAKLFREDQTVDLAFSGHRAGEWVVGRADSILNLYLIAAPGETTLQLRAPAIAEQGNSQRTLSIMLTSAELR
jgi:hypothetical protein